uniref:Uncharacterized protein n=1 Tax=Anguilla anguilla TaxID=7936 RepID=A0A0E9SP58_ANGAN
MICRPMICQTMSESSCQDRDIFMHYHYNLCDSCPCLIILVLV